MTPLNLSRFALVIFDADDTLRRTRVEGQPCPHGPGEWELLPNVRETLKHYDWTRLRLGVASNQDHVSFALLSHSMARRLLRDMLEAAIGEPAARAFIRFCPHNRDDRCSCRKPQPDMLLDICASAGVAPASALFVGNAFTDLQCAMRAGTSFAWSEVFFNRWP